MKRTIRRMFIGPLLKVRAKRLSKGIESILGDCKTVLDVGCGDGVLASELEKTTDFSMTLVDTINSNLTHQPVILYDGVTLPFADKSFDAAIVVFVLHHCDDIESVLHEIMRVTRKKILIYEEIADHWVSRIILHAHDKGNIFLSSKMNIPLNFKSVQEWETLFATNGLTVKKVSRVYQYHSLISLTKFYSRLICKSKCSLFERTIQYDVS